jgi:hypothetical protein
MNSIQPVLPELKVTARTGLCPHADLLSDLTCPASDVNVQYLWLTKLIGDGNIIGRYVGSFCQVDIQRLVLSELGIVGCLPKGFLCSVWWGYKYPNKGDLSSLFAKSFAVCNKMYRYMVIN